MNPQQQESHADVSTGQPVRQPQHRLVKWSGIGLFIVVIGFLVAVVLPTLLGNRTLVIISGSMEPTIPMGAAAVMRPVPSSALQVGDVIAYTPNAAGAIPIVHRIVNISEQNGVRYYQTRGDANQTPDAHEFTLPSTAWRLWYDLPVAGYVVAFASSRLGTLLLIVIPAVLLVWLKIGDWRKSHRVAASEPARSP